MSVHDLKLNPLFAMMSFIGFGDVFDSSETRQIETECFSKELQLESLTMSHTESHHRIVPQSQGGGGFQVKMNWSRQERGRARARMSESGASLFYRRR